MAGNSKRSSFINQYGPAVAGFCLALAVSGCTTSALQGVKPQTAAATTNTDTKAASADKTATTGNTDVPGVTSTASQLPQQQAKKPARSAARASKRQVVSRRKPVAQDKGTADQNAEFVQQGVAKSNAYPNFVPPKAATTQMSDREKKAFEAQMAARMKAGAKPSETQAEYEQRLKLMRALAAEHGSDTLDSNGK